MVLDYEKILGSLPIWTQPVQISKLQGGLTNINYVIKVGKKRYVARFAPASNTFLGLERDREICNTKATTKLGIGPEYEAYFPEYNLLILKYLSGKTCTPQLARKPQMIKRLAKTLHQLHQSNGFQGTDNPFKWIQRVIQLVKQKESWLPQDIDSLLLDLKDIQKKVGPYKNVPCHMDLMIENIIIYQNKIKIIDWEYSVNSDFRFDLAMLSYKGSFEKREDLLLLKEYGREDLFQEIQLMKAVVALREAAWSATQLAFSSIPIDYRTYAEIDFEKYRKLIQTAKENTI